MEQLEITKQRLATLRNETKNKFREVEHLRSVRKRLEAQAIRLKAENRDKYSNTNIISYNSKNFLT